MKDRNKGIFYIILAAFFFSLMTFFVRLSGDLPTMQKAFFRNIVAAVISIAMILKNRVKLYERKRNIPLLFLRAGFGTMGLICNFYAIDHMNISDANMLNKLSPFFAIAMSYFILKEKAGIIGWISVAIAFVGTLFVVKPGFGLDTFPALMGVLGGFGAGVAYTFVRKLGKNGVNPSIIVMFFSTFSSLVVVPFMIHSFSPMTVWQLIILLLAGLSATGGQLCITMAYTKAPASEISVYDYMQVIFAAVWGLLFLNQIPDYLSIIGYVIIIGAAVFRFEYNKNRQMRN